MAKRKRLTPQPQGAPETKAHAPWGGLSPRPPIADVTADTARQAAFDEVAGELRAARDEGRMVVRLPLGAIVEDYLVRDRTGLDADEFETLKTSLADRGQQTPIDVVALSEGRYGLLAGWRRLRALKALEVPEVLALVRQPGATAQAYRAMVEENEIRTDLSFFERARIAVRATEEGVYGSVSEAVSGLFAAARPAKRSKIIAFSHVVAGLGDALRYPQAVPEKVGLQLAARLKEDAGFGPALAAKLGIADPKSAPEERAVLDRVLSAPAGGRGNGIEAPAKAAPENLPEVVPGITLQTSLGKREGRVVLRGAGIDQALIEDLSVWLANRS